jgi:prevent-host-death family protein
MHRRRGEIIKRCYRDNEHFIVERAGYPIAAIVPIADYQRWVQSGKSPDLTLNRRE